MQSWIRDWTCRQSRTGRFGHGLKPRGVAALCGFSGCLAASGFLLGFSAVPSSLHAAETPDQMIDKAYGPQLAKVKASPDTKDDLELAQNMASDAKGMGQDPATQTALLRRALWLSVEDQEGAELAESILSTLVTKKTIKEEKAWQELVDKAKDALRRRNLGKADKMYDAYFNWQMQLVRAAMEGYDGPAAEKVLTALATDAAALKLKYQADEARQLIARIRLEAPFLTAAAAARAKAGGDDLTLKANEDPKLNLAAGETILSQTGDWVDATPFLVRSKDVRWNLILNMHKLRHANNDSPADELLPHPPRSTLASYTVPVLDVPPLGQAAQGAANASAEAPPPPPPSKAGAGSTDANGKRTLPTMPQGMHQSDLDKMSQRDFDALKRAVERARPAGEDSAPDADTPAPAPAAPASVKTDDLLEAADYLTAMAAPAKRPSPVAKVALLREAAGLLAQAQSADNANMTVTQKLELPNRRRAADDASDKAVTDLIAAYDRVTQMPWVPLSAGTLKADWSSTEAYAHWKLLDGGVLQSTSGNWDTMLRSTKASYSDFVFECEFMNDGSSSHALFFFRDHFGPPFYQVEIMRSHAFLAFRKDLFNFNTDIADEDTSVRAKTWTPVRVVFEGDHYMVWVNGKKSIDAHAVGNTGAGPVCLLGMDGTISYRNLRIRELR